MKHWKYLSYVVRHKWFVLVEAYRFGILWRGLVHDLSKFHPSEWFPYADYFYGDYPMAQETRCWIGYTGKTQESVNRDFDFAWLLHQKRNPHHWQYWVLPEDNGGTTVLEMPLDYVYEMVADWKGAGRALGKTAPDECRKWYLANKHKMQLHAHTRLLVEILLGVAS